MKKDVTKMCPLGEIIAPELSKEAAKTETIETKVEALESKLAAVLAATASDSGKKLAIGSDGKVTLTT